MNPIVAVITPTYRRDAKTLNKCIRSVQWQTYPAVEHYICHDGPWEKDPAVDLLRSTVPAIWLNTPTRTNTYGASVRQYVLDQLPPGVKYLVHLDDDNLLFPDFVEEHVKLLEENPDAGFSICRISHNGPLPEHLGEAPKILTGIPPVFRNIDTLQVVVRTEAMQQCAWSQFTGTQGYCNDGYTYQRLGEMFKWVEVPKLLAIHM